MANCAITGSIDITCDDKRKVGGVKERAWLVNSLEGFDYTLDDNGYITALTFGDYGGLYTLQGLKNSHSGGYTLTRQEGGSVYYQHDVTLKTISTSPADDGVIEELAATNIPMILETRNREFFLYGYENGLQQTEGSQNTGQAAASDIADILTFAGEERGKPRRILITDYATTLAQLEEYEI